MTVHNRAKKGEIAKNVIMPGDPLRAEWIAKKYLKECKKVSDIRGMCVFTGTYLGTPITVMPSGMGCPSMMIYAWELYGEYDVENIIRVGTCGAYQDEIKLRDLIFSMTASTDSNIQTHFNIPGDWKFAPNASFELLKNADAVASKKEIRHFIGSTVCSDAFYTMQNIAPDYHKKSIWSNVNALCSEMETYALYACANHFKKNALAIFTASMVYNDNRELSSEERQSSLEQMILVALDTLAA